MTWPIVSLGEIFDIARGGSPRPIDKYITDDKDGINWVSIGDASESSKYITRTARKILPSGVVRSRTVKPGDFLLTNSMSFGRPYIMGTTGCIHDGWLVLAPKKQNVDNDFMYHLLGSPAVYGEFVRLAAGATVKNLNIELVSQVKVPLPPLSAQRRIAAILDQADELRRKRSETRSIIPELGRSLFDDMFGSPVDNRKSWDVAPIGLVATKIGSGATPTGGETAYKSEGIPLVRSMNVHDAQFVDEGLAFLDEHQARKLDNVIIHKGDVLLNITGASVARVCRAPDRVSGGRVNQHVSIIRPGKRIRSHFLEAALLHPSVKANLLRIGEAGATRQAITKAQIEQFPMIVPPIKLQLDFETRVLALDFISDSTIESSKSLDRLFASLQQRAFDGEL